MDEDVGDLKNAETYRIEREAWKNTLKHLEEMQLRQIDVFISQIISDTQKDRKELRDTLNKVKNILLTLNKKEMEK